MKTTERSHTSRLCRPFTFFLFVYALFTSFVVASTDSLKATLLVTGIASAIGLVGGIGIALFDQRSRLYEEIGIAHWQVFLGSFALLAFPSIIAWGQFVLLAAWVGIALLMSAGVVVWSLVTAKGFPIVPLHDDEDW